MNNADMPASPVDGVLYSKEVDDYKSSIGKTLTTIDVKAYGLTKREHFAAMAMQGLCANKDYITDDWMEIIVKQSVIIADGLLKELEK